MTMNPILISSDGGKKVNVLGISMVIRIHGSDTGGVVSVVESHDVPGGDPPPHIHHREDETFDHGEVRAANPAAARGLKVLEVPDSGVLDCASPILLEY
jgi:hypothetical protein